jgi:hypothetical protein
MSTVRSPQGSLKFTGLFPQNTYWFIVTLRKNDLKRSEQSAPAPGYSFAVQRTILLPENVSENRLDGKNKRVEISGFPSVCWLRVRAPLSAVRYISVVVWRFLSVLALF